MRRVIPILTLLLLALPMRAQKPQAAGMVYCEVVENAKGAVIIPNEDYLNQMYWDFILKEDGKPVAFKNKLEAITRLSPFGWTAEKTWYDPDKKETHVLMGHVLDNSMSLKSSRDRLLKMAKIQDSVHNTTEYEN